MAAIERIAYEFCEQAAANDVIYVEARYCPHLLLADVFNNSKVDYINHNSKIAEVENVTVHAIVEAVNRGFARGEKDFGVIARSILSCIRGKPEWSREILELCVEFREKGVVGIDIAGNEGGIEIIEGEENGKTFWMISIEDVLKTFLFLQRSVCLTKKMLKYSVKQLNWVFTVLYMLVKLVQH